MWSPSRSVNEAAASDTSLEVALVRTTCSIFRVLFVWFDFGKEVASLTKIIRNVGLVLIFVKTESILVSF